MMETDLWQMTALTFLPALFALILLFIPSGSKELLRWTTLLGTALTLAVSLVVFIGFYDMLERSPVARATELKLHAKSSLLEGRVDQAIDRSIVKEGPDGRGVGMKAALPDDLVARTPWIGRFNIEYYMGIDGISMPLVLLTTLLSFLSMIASWGIEKHVKGYCMLFLLLETGMLGCFLALDFFLFYIFWEVMLLPMYFLIGVWGGPRREYAAIKFFLYTLLGSVFILIAMLAFYFTDVRDFVRPEVVKTKAVAVAVREGLTEGDAEKRWQEFSKDASVHTFDLITLHKVGRAAMLVLNGKTEDVIRDAPSTDKEGMRARLASEFFFTKGFQYTMFLLLFVGFAIKVPLFPFHTWLPDAHVEAPTPISMILAGVLLKLGGYGILRIAYPICPWAACSLALPIAIFGVINIVYGAFAAMAQTDFKKLVAYSSVSHMGYVILGIAVWSTQSQHWEWAMNGAMFQMIAHGVTSAAMFFMVGVIYDRAHHRDLNNFRGLMEPMPLYGGMAFLVFFAALGLPGMCGFIGEVMVVIGTWNYSPTLAVITAFAVILTAAYILWTLQRVYFGTNDAYKDFPDMSLRELSIGVPLLVLSIALGIFPGQLLLNWMQPSVSGLVDSLSRLGGVN